MSTTAKFVLMAQPSAPAIPHTEVLERWAAELRAEFEGLEVVIAATEEEILEQLSDADAAYGVLPAGWHAPRLRWLQAPMANPPLGYFTPELAAHPAVVTNMRGVYNDHIATHVMAFLLAFGRGLPHYVHDQRNREYRGGLAPVLHLADSTVLFIGAGGVAHQAARYLQPWGPRVVAADARPEITVGGAIDAVFGADELEARLPLADVVVMTVPHTAESEGMLGRAQFALMKPTAVFINIGRGMTVVLNDLVDALEAGELAGAGLDVFDQEPLPPDHRVWTLPNVLITPHVAMVGPDIDQRRFELVAGNCRRLLAGEPLQYVVADKILGF
ncbi:MAG: D-2-hydroxyacid dehydrogenase [Acidimicrobiales bacterium]|nr:D-2-hydroxyacid dehydrogenase [Acidimicrobiales bacterium]MYI10345.1 D-2-hydroxyacid dehydrogenase [Acidimicrobiales bacterium]